MVQTAPKNKEQNGSKKKRLHPIELALQWQWEIRMDPAHSPARIAAREGISRARVTQLMNLLHLPEQIQNKLQHPPAPLKVSSFSERCLRQIVACGDPQSQVRQWQELLRECHILALI